MAYRIVTDSSSNVLALENENYASVPMKIMVEKEYVDNAALDVAAMVEDLRGHKGKSGSSCPNVGEWLDAFGDAEEVFAITITKHLSGSYNAAFQAAQDYMEAHPERRVCVIDSLSAGPQLMLLAEKIRACEAAGDDFETTRDKVLAYQNTLHTLFCLESVMNLARNGRLNPAVAKIAGMLGIRVAGDAEGGELALCHKPRGHRRTTRLLVDMIRERGFRDGNIIRVSHCFADEAAESFWEALLAEFPNARFRLEPTTALCSFYAESGGLIIAFEGSFNEKNDNRKF